MIIEDYEARVFTSSSGDTLPYRLLVPRGYRCGQKVLNDLTALLRRCQFVPAIELLACPPLNLAKILPVPPLDFSRR